MVIVISTFFYNIYKSLFGLADFLVQRGDHLNFGNPQAESIAKPQGSVGLDN